MEKDMHQAGWNAIPKPAVFTADFRFDGEKERLR
jgi:hypothetical protein